MGEATNRVRSTKSASADPYNVPFDDTGILKVDETPGWEVLKQKAEPVTEFDAAFKETALSMVPRMYRAHGCGLAAPQVGISKRFLIYDAGNGPTVVVNPVITKERGEAFQNAAAGIARTELLNESKFIRDEIQLEVAQLQRKIDAARASGPVTTTAAPAPAASSPAIDDALYIALEDAFRGDPIVIRARQHQYLPYVQNVVTQTAPLLDIGCGRGEWLNILKDSNIPATGIDTNAASVQECSAQGLNVSHADAISYLSDAKEKSLGAITLFQVLEHLPFPTMVHLLRLALRALVPGGVLIAEVPNSETLSVGASTFWIDPTHERPLFPGLLEFLATEVGYTSVEGVYSSPLAPEPDFSELAPHVREPLLAMHRQLNGNGDFAIIATA
jgi:SAM-dependent methyltransferase